MKRAELARTSFVRKAKPDTTPKRRQRKCAVCRSLFEPRSMTHKCCELECAEEYAIKERQREDRKETRARLDTLKTRSDHIKAAQVAFNAFVRYRDRNELCICCDKPLSTETVGGAYDCGHYRSRGSAPHLRFHEQNAHAQLKQCNRWGAGRAVDYRIGLIKRIGLAAVDALESDNEPRKYSIDELKEIKEHYKKKLKELKG